MTLLNWKDKPNSNQALPTRSDTLTFTITLPKGEEIKGSTALNRWAGLGGLLIGNDEKNFIRGIIAGLQLNNAQKQTLLRHYAAVWNKAHQRERSPNRKRNQGYYAANTWLRTGAKGFIQRQLE
jgi:hypothetical protein